LLPCWVSSARKARLQKSPEDDATEIAGRLGLKKLLSQNVLQLSVGQQQRVAVARALIGHPEILIADEPTSSLDEEMQKEFLKLLLDRTRESNATVIFVSHNRSLAAQFDRSVSLLEMNQIHKSRENGL
ncbi:MAG: putative ABC-type transport system, ATPase component, partial [Bacteriovoracaceae bacterium]|nr:putative ABC-type transport system, ATPase component [Bacteriovoracaceae bacterium]